jgi:hypothetical protein
MPNKKSETTKPKAKPKPKEKEKPKPKPKAKPKAKPKPKVKPKPEEIPKKGLTFKIDNPNETIDESKYAIKVKNLLVKLKHRSDETDNRIRFCWKN